MRYLKSAAQKVSRQYFDSTALHEITECIEMAGGKTFWEAHQIALREEIKKGILKDPYIEVD